MKGIMIEKPNVLKIVDLPMPELSEANDVLVKIRDTVSLRGSSEIVRAQEVRGAYAVKNAPPDLKGARIVLVDDVVTTGATTGECCRVLREAGAGEVIVVCFASSRGRQAQT